MTFAVTISFVLGTAVIVLAMYAIAELTGRGIGVTQGIGDWLRLGVFIAALSAFAGLFVDVLRYLADAFWRKKMRFGLKLKKLMRQNLA